MIFSDDFGGKAMGETVYCVLIDFDMTMRSEPTIHKIFSSQEKADEFLNKFKNQYPHHDAKVVRFTVE